MVLGFAGSVQDAVADAVGWLAGAAGWVWRTVLHPVLNPVLEILDRFWAPLLAAVVAVFLLRTVRWLLLLWRGRTPRVQISSFAWTTSDDANQEATWVTSLFREQLAALRLDALDPLPERAPGAPLVEIVEGVGQGVGKDIAAAAAKLFRAVWPDSAYEVWGSLRPRETGGGRISVQLIERRRGNRTLLNVALEEASWEEGAREAALAVAGALYPRVQVGQRGPWTLWENSVPRQLMRHYHDARRYEEENRLEHALAAYHDALNLDPLNPNLRLKIAMLLERLELDLDAWVTYEAIVDESSSKAWRGPNRRVYLLALYRLAVMMSNGRVAAQWIKGARIAPNAGTKRDQERHERREELLMLLENDSFFEKHLFRLPHELPQRLTWTVWALISSSPSFLLMTVLRRLDGEAGDPGDVLEPFRQLSEDEEGRERRIGAVLQVLGLRRLEELEAALRIRFPRRGNRRQARVRRRPRRRPLGHREFSAAAIKTSKRLVRIRIATGIETRLRRVPAGSQADLNRDRWLDELRAAHKRLTRRWPFPAPGWRQAVRRISPVRYLANRREDAWQLHYNAACANASILRDDSPFQRFKAEKEDNPSCKLRRKLDPLPRKADENKVILRAIAELEGYASRAGSRRVGAHADWVAIDDPDLVGLRKTPAFKLWASHHLPRSLPRGLPSRKTDVKRFTIRVVQEGARIFAAVWRERATRAGISAADIVSWWQVEAEIWKALGSACREHLSWQERLRWLSILQDWLCSADVEEEVDFSHELRGAFADSMSNGLFEELATLAGAGSDNGAAVAEGSGGAPPAKPCVLVWVNDRMEHVRRAHEAGEEQANRSGSLRHVTEREAALRAARVWTRLAETLEIELTGACAEDSDETVRERMAVVREELPRPPVPAPQG